MIGDWLDLYQDRVGGGRPARVIYLDQNAGRYRCVYHQTPYQGNINPYAVVKCKARGGRRLSFEAYA